MKTFAHFLIWRKSFLIFALLNFTRSIEKEIYAISVVSARYFRHFRPREE
jgi:hypothetical protein